MGRDDIKTRLDRARASLEREHAAMAASLRDDLKKHKGRALGRI